MSASNAFSAHSEPEPVSWDDFKQLVRWFVMLFGAPADLTAQGAVERKAARLICGWLCALEALARALLVSLAAGLPKPSMSAKRVRLGRAARVRPWTDPFVQMDDASESWVGVSFRLLPPPSGGWSGCREADDLKSRFVFTRRMAMRFEALIRVAKQPDRYARRVARRLHGKPAVARRILRAPQVPNCARCPEVGDAQELARRTLRAFEASG